MPSGSRDADTFRYFSHDCRSRYTILHALFFLQLSLPSSSFPSFSFLRPNCSPPIFVCRLRASGRKEGEQHTGAERPGKGRESDRDLSAAQIVQGGRRRRAIPRCCRTDTTFPSTPLSVSIYYYALHTYTRDSLADCLLVPVLSLAASHPFQVSVCRDDMLLMRWNI